MHVYRKELLWKTCLIAFCYSRRFFYPYKTVTWVKSITKPKKRSDHKITGRNQFPLPHWNRKDVSKLRFVVMCEKAFPKDQASNKTINLEISIPNLKGKITIKAMIVIGSTYTWVQQLNWAYIIVLQLKILEHLDLQSYNLLHVI